MISWVLAGIAWLGSGGCGDADAKSSDAGDSTSVVADVADDGELAFDTAAEVTEPVEPSETLCPRAFLPGPYGVHRGDRAADFALPLVGGGTFILSERFDGCASVVVFGDMIPVSASDATSLWESEADLAALVARSPTDVHYLFVARGGDDAAARIAAMRARVDGVLGALSSEDRAHWELRLSVAATPANELPGPANDWVRQGLGAHLRPGFAIDHAQRLRGLGSLADVTRYDQALSDAEQWPWRSNLAYLAHEADYMSAEAARRAALATDGATRVDVWRGEVLSQFAEADVVLPAAEALAAFDTLEVEITLRCPDPDQPELGNCGAWDYLASLSLYDADGVARIELARFITPYHREAHWVVDATPALALLAAGGTRRLRWDFAPEWNVQPTATWMTLRLSNRGKGHRPVALIPLFTGGDFGSAYNTARAPAVVPVPADAARVEVWSLVTGHGSGTSQCAEFCAHQHWIEVGDRVAVKGFPEAGVEDGCVASIARGMTPNQAGTWWFGRGGWCPGAPVEPWVVDITADVTPGGEVTISYRGTLAGSEPPDGAGNIVLSTYMIVYAAMP